MVFAIIGGCLFGLIIAFGIFRINNTTRPKGASTEASPTPEAIGQEFKITLAKPENNDVVTENSVTVSGITKPLSWITVAGESSDYMIQSSEDGSFSQDVELAPGVNQIKITAFDSQGSQSTEKVLVVYSSVFQTRTAEPSPESNSTESSIRENVQKKVNEALNKPKAYIGTITDIAESTIQIKSSGGSIEQISVDPDTLNVVKQTGTSAAKTIKLTDVGIGDFIVAMGYTNSNSVLDAQRILVTDQITDNSINSYLAKIDSIKGSSITATTIKDQKELSITPGKNTDIYLFKNSKATTTKVSNLEKDSLIILVNDEGGKTPTPRSIFAISQG